MASSSNSKPQMLYALVARGQTVLAQYAAVSGNFQNVTQKILEKVPTHDSKMSYVYDEGNIHFHYIVQDTIVYMCVTDKEYPRRISFQFLDTISERFRSMYGDKGKTAAAGQFQDDFRQQLMKQMDHHNSGQSDKITQVRQEIEGVKHVMVENIEKVLERGDKITLLVDKTEQMNREAVAFKRAGTRLKRAMWWKNFKLMAILVAVVLVVGFIIFLFACGGFKCTHKDKK